MNGQTDQPTDWLTYRDFFLHLGFRSQCLTLTHPAWSGPWWHHHHLHLTSCSVPPHFPIYWPYISLTHLSFFLMRSHRQVGPSLWMPPPHHSHQPKEFLSVPTSSMARDTLSPSPQWWLWIPAHGTMHLPSQHCCNYAFNVCFSDKTMWPLRARSGSEAPHPYILRALRSSW